MVFKCHCCGKEFKTEGGFKKHFCKYQQRFITIEENNWYPLWIQFKRIFKMSMKKDTNKEYYEFTHFKFYNDLTAFFSWIKISSIIDVNEYMDYLKRHRHPIKNWCNDLTYKAFIKEFIVSELPAIAIDRSKKYLKDNNLDITSITQNNLYFGILSGNISNKFLTHIGIDARKILDAGQYNDVKDLLV